MPNVEVNGTSIYYEARGSGHPLVFIHAGGLESSSWHFQMEYFSKNYRVIAYDVRGHGRSEVPEDNYSIGDCVEDLRQLLDSLSLQRIYVSGISMGGNVALSFTLNHPERVDALILAGSNSGPMIESTRKTSEDAVAKIAKLRGAEAGDRYMKVHIANVTRPDLTDRLSEIQKPVLIIVGERDVAAPSYLSESMHKRIANSQMIVIPDCGHKCNEETPDTYNSIVSDFLQSIESV